jgi:hypothetical protein
MDSKDFIGMVLLIVFLGVPFVAIYLTFHYFSDDAGRYVIRDLFIWLEWLFGFFFAVSLSWKDFQISALILTFAIIAFIVVNPFVIFLVLVLSAKTEEKNTIFENANIISTVKPPRNYLKMAFLANLTATLALITIYGSAALVVTTYEKYYPSKQEFTIYD